MWFWLTVAGWMLAVGVFAATSAVPARRRLLTYLLGIPLIALAAAWVLLSGMFVAFVVESVRRAFGPARASEHS